MSTEVQIIRAREFIQLDTDNHLDLEASRSKLKARADACRESGNERILLDVRNPEGGLAPTDLAILVRAFGDVGFPDHQHLAVLHSSDQGYLADMFASLSTLHGWKMQAFLEFEEALDWLALNRHMLQEPALSAPAKAESKPADLLTQPPAALQRQP